MTMMQEDIQQYYQQNWQQTLEKASDVTQLAYSNPVEDAVLYPLYELLLRDSGVRVDGGRILDVGSGSGRWARFFLERFRPARFVGIDFASSSIDLLRKWHPQAASCRPEFIVADVTSPGMAASSDDRDDIGGPFDIINIANVLFHIPEPDRFDRALQNLAMKLAPGGRIITTEYMPRMTRRTKWMLVRSRYDFTEAAKRAGLRIIDIRATGFFANDPLGLDGPDGSVRARFNSVRQRMEALWSSCTNEDTRRFVQQLYIEVERAVMAFSEERVPAIDFPSQKLVILGRG